MKHILLYMAATLALLASCYDDKGGNDYDTALPDVEMTIPETAYSAALGSTITITPDVNTTIAEDDLEFLWEVNGDVTNEHGRSYYAPLLNDDEQGKVLNYTCHLDTAITALNKSYTCRLHARQKSTGRDFYSVNTFTITIAGLTGLLVLHGDDSQCDVGVLEADEFMPSSSSLPASPSATPDLYSQNNSGNKIAGRGEIILHTLPNGYSNYSRYSDRFRILAKTDKTAEWLNYADLSKYGDWNSIFYLKDERAVNDNAPKGFGLCDNNFVGFDGDDVFIMRPTSQYPFLFADFTPDTECGDGNAFTFYPYFLEVTTSGVEYVSYATSVNGDKSRCGFVAMNQVSPSNTTRYTKLMDTGNDEVPFNPGDMNADLLCMRTDSLLHVMAVLRGNSANASYAGKLFAVDIYPNATAAGESGYGNAPQYQYDLSTLTNINNAFAFEFGSTKNMCYYATPGGVYQYGVDGSTLYPSEALAMTDGSALSISGEITMMKFLNSPNITTRNTEPILLVATYSGGSSALYALHMDETTGKVLKAVKYDSTNVTNWGFGKIYDVNIKAI